VVEKEPEIGSDIIELQSSALKNYLETPRQNSITKLKSRILYFLCFSVPQAEWSEAQVATLTWSISLIPLTSAAALTVAEKKAVEGLVTVIF